MSENVKIWFNNLISNEILEVNGTISNEEIFEKGYTGKDDNPHTNNLKELHEYVEFLEEIKFSIKEK